MKIAIIGGVLSILIISLGSIGLLSAGNSIIATFTCMGITLIASLWSISKQNQKEEERKAKDKEERRKNEAQELEDMLNITCPTIIHKLESTGFSSLNQAEKSYLFKLSDQMGSNLDNLHENEVKVLEVAFSNQGVYNMLQMRSNQLQPNNQAALKHLKTIKYATMLSGLNAAREIGEDIGESFSE